MNAFLQAVRWSTAMVSSRRNLQLGSAAALLLLRRSIFFQICSLPSSFGDFWCEVLGHRRNVVLGMPGVCAAPLCSFVSTMLGVPVFPILFILILQTNPTATPPIVVLWCASSYWPAVLFLSQSSSGRVASVWLQKFSAPGLRR